MGGIGKTTLAAKLFNSLLPDYNDAACFLLNVSKAGLADGLIKLQQKLLKVLGGVPVFVDDTEVGTSHRMILPYAHPKICVQLSTCSSSNLCTAAFVTARLNMMPCSVLCQAHLCLTFVHL